MKFFSGFVLLLIAAFMFAPANFHAQQKKAGDLTVEPYVFQAQNGEKVEAELGRLIVPENRNNPKSNLIELAFVRFKSTSKNPGSPIVYLAGGPGGSGIGTARGTRFPLFMAMREIGDVIAFDQRATGLSRPSLPCRGTLDYPLDKPGDPQEILRLFSERARACAEYWKEQGVDLSGYNTNESADDLEDLRKALGAEKISLWSISYGTHLALAAIRRHEPGIDRVILAGTEGPDHSLKLPSNIQKNLEKISRLAKADPDVSAKVPDLLALIKTVLDKLEKQPFTLEYTDTPTNAPIKVTVGKFDIQRLTASVVGNEAVVGIPSVYYALSKGDISNATLRAIARRVIGERRGAIGSAMPYMMDCASGASDSRRRRVEREAKETLLSNAIDFPFPGVCPGWGSPDLGRAFRSSVKSKVPALFISGTLDARTPVSNAEEIRKGFSNSAHLIIDGAVHSDPLFLSSPKIKDVMLEFMKGQPLSTTSITLPPLKFFPVN